MVAMDVDGEIADDPSDSFLTLTLSLPVKATALHLQALSADGPLYLFTGQSKGLIQGTPIESSLQTDREEGEEDEEEIEFPFKPFRVQVAHQDADRHSILALSTGSLFTAYDTIAGDADGLLVVLSRGHVLQKFEAGGPVMCVLQLEDGCAFLLCVKRCPQNSKTFPSVDDQIIVGDFHGKITCFQGTERYWALNLPPSPKSTEVRSFSRGLPRCTSTLVTQAFFEIHIVQPIHSNNDHVLSHRPTRP